MPIYTSASYGWGEGSSVGRKEDTTSGGSISRKKKKGSRFKAAIKIQVRVHNELARRKKKEQVTRNHKQIKIAVNPLHDCGAPEPNTYTNRRLYALPVQDVGFDGLSYHFV
ncbi:putative IQ motif, EF-hand binding protein [Helianthus annuus]|uniref:IQ motif, EF-hand binding protein n=1 Tax=Helianthus annuus TaxID=4232 RepID=A0A9K3EJ91_HELAN|nr:putative IQ motif, EF-hand binding protein [Helianthus annuus]KAJ0850115.1 putative IQ motif, EF-hand binding protein [Helianthus annuus]